MSLQLNLGVTPAHNNQYLFADHYLDELLPADPRWWAGLDQAEKFLDWLQGHYQAENEQLAAYNETQLEEHWFKPILKQLGHVWEPQASVPGLDEGVKRPDYIFFPGEAARQEAASLQNSEAYAQAALAACATSPSSSASRPFCPTPRGAPSSTTSSPPATPMPSPWKTTCRATPTRRWKRSCRAVSTCAKTA